MNIDWNEIKEKYPKIWKIFLKKINVEYFVSPMGYQFLRKYNEYTCQYDIDICYCDIEKFFDDNELLILLDYEYKNMQKDKYWFYIVENYDSEENREIYNSRDKAKEQAIYKAFEILEQQIKE